MRLQESVGACARVVERPSGTYASVILLLLSHIPWMLQ
jgi:hypothetical protein